MKELRCIIVDDEPLARQQLGLYVARTPFLVLVAVTGNILQTELILESTEADLIFLDIKMPGISGLDFLKQGTVKAQVILVSAYPDYALEGFELQVTDYLTKPVPYARFLRASKRALALAQQIPNDKLEYLYIKNGQRYEKVMLKDILYIEALGNYVALVTPTARHIQYTSLKNMEATLPEGMFIRINKSCLVAIGALTHIARDKVQVGEVVLPVSRGRSKAVMGVVK